MKPLLPTLLLGALACTGLSHAQSRSITLPAVSDGSNWSRAPFAAARPFDDAKGPDGEAFDEHLSATPDLPLPPPRVAIFQSAPPAMAVASTSSPTVTAPAVASPEPALTPTGRSSVGVAAGLDAVAMGNRLRSASLASREQILTDIENRLTSTEKSVRRLGDSVDAGTRQAYQAARDEVQTKAEALRQSLAAARKAGQDEWESARSRLAADYDAYTDALSRVDTTVGSAP